MPNLQIFGETIDVPIEGFDGRLGALNNNLKIQPKQEDGVTILHCTFKGKLPLGELRETEWKLECSVKRGTYVVNTAVLIRAGRLHVEDIGFPVLDTQVNSVAVSRCPRQSVVFGTDTPMLNPLLRNMTSGIAVTLEPDSYEKDDFWLTVDFPYAAFSFEPKGNMARLSVRHFYNLNGRFESDQLVPVVAVQVTEKEVLVRGHTKRLYVHGDLIDKRPRSSSNQVFFQHALVNGELHFVAPIANLRDISLRWEKAPNSSSPPVLLALRWRDENGHPLAFHPKQGAFTLTERNGFHFTVPDGADANTVELSNQTVGVTSTETESWLLWSLDPVAHYLDEDDVDAEYGPVVLAEGAPREIHGMASGVVLNCPVSTNAPLACTFNCTSIKDSRGRVIGWLPEIQLGGDGPDWTLEVFLEERDSHVGHTLSRREAKGKAGKRGPALPLVDAMVVGVNLLPPKEDAAVPYGGLIVAALEEWLSRQDEQFIGIAPQWLNGPAMSTAQPQVHRTGFALVPGGETLGRVVGQLRTSATVDELFPPSPRLQPAPPISLAAIADANAPSGYIHGLQVDDQFDKKLQDIEERLSNAPIWNDAWIQLMNQWVAPDPDLIIALDEIRRLLNVTSSLPPAPPQEWEDDEQLEAWLDLKARAWEIASMGDLDDLDVLDGESLTELLEMMDVEEFAALCLAATEQVDDGLESPFLPLVRWLDAPMGPDLFRRVVYLLQAAIGTEPPPRFKKLIDACSDVRLQVTDLYKRLVGDEFFKQADKLMSNLKGILTDLGLGEAEQLHQIRDAWRRGTSAAFLALKKRFGPILTDDLLDSIAKNAADAQSLLSALNEAGVAIHDLADVVRRPPEYLFATRRFASIGSEWDKAMRLWSGRFGLANLAQDLNWHFFLGDASTLIVKLGDQRSIVDILLEAHTRFSTDGRPDPLGLGDLDPRKKTIDGGLAFLRRKLGRQLLEPSWTGLLILRPMADISEDIKMRDLCGLEYIDALYVAVAGRPLEHGGLDVSAVIESRSEDDELAKLQGHSEDEWEGDVDFGLIKFSVVIRRSVLDEADIAFQLRVKNLLGSKHPDDRKDKDKEKNKGVQSINIRGTLAHADPSQPDKSRDIQLAAVLDPAKNIPIRLLCFDSVDFAGLLIGHRDGRTYLDIDADIKLMDAPDVGPYSKFFESTERLKLQGFRIALPSLQNGEMRRLGEAIGLDFEWPSVELSMPQKRGMRLFGLEVTPISLGVLRNTSTAEWDRFKDRFLSIENWPLPELDPQEKFMVPHVRFRVSFGSLPGLGGGGKLSFDLVFGLVVEGGFMHTFIAVDGVEGKKITLDLFRLITVTIDELVFKRNWLFQLNEHPELQASGLVADRVELKILNWNPFGEGAHLSLANFHRTDTNDEYQANGFVIGYEAKKNNEKKDEDSSSNSFVKIHWIVVGQNIELPKKAYDYLLASGGEFSTAVDDTKSLLTNLLVYAESEDENKSEPRELVNGKLNATFTKNPSWLFGISFSLGDVLQLGNLVLHDQHYYGIRLRDPNWLPLVFGQDTIEFAYIPGTRRELDRFRTNLRIPLLDMLGPMTSGEIALEWALNWDFLIDVGFPWKTTAGHNWFRAFSLPVGTYEGKFGFFMEKKTNYEVVSSDETLMLGCGAAFYVGLYAGYGNSVAYVRAGIGIFGIYEGRFWLKNAKLDRPETLLKATIVQMHVSGTIGIFAYAEGRIEVWIISASFRAWAEASLTSEIIYVPGSTCAIAYSAVLAAGYSASVEVGSGWLSWTFSVSGTVEMPVSGRLLLA